MYVAKLWLLVQHWLYGTIHSYMHGWSTCLQPCRSPHFSLVMSQCQMSFIQRIHTETTVKSWLICSTDEQHWNNTINSKLCCVATVWDCGGKCLWEGQLESDHSTGHDALQYRWVARKFFFPEKETRRSRVRPLYYSKDLLLLDCVLTLRYGIQVQYCKILHIFTKS